MGRSNQLAHPKTVRHEFNHPFELVFVDLMAYITPEALEGSSTSETSKKKALSGMMFACRRPNVDTLSLRADNGDEYTSNELKVTVVLEEYCRVRQHKHAAEVHTFECV